MGLLSQVNTHRKAAKKDDNRVVTELSTPSGFLWLDYANGVRVTSYDDFDRPTGHYDLIGLVNGTMTTVIGLSGTGKSALAMSLAASGIYKFGRKSMARHHDIEMATTMQRPVKTLKLPPSLLRDTYEINRLRGAEDITEMFIDHCEIKLANRKEYTYDTGIRDLYNEPIYELYPSAELIDSFAMFKSKDIDLTKKDVDVENVSHNMIAAQSAKLNKAVLGQMVGVGKTANVSLICINHLNPNVNTGFMPKPSQHMYLTQDESMPGGSASIFLANNIIKLKVLKKFDINKNDQAEYGIPGFIVDARLLKSRTNAANLPVELIFDHRIGGFSKTISLLHFAFKHNLLQGNPGKHFLPGMPDVRFSRKNFEEVAMRTGGELLQALYEACLPTLESLLSTDNGLGADNDSDSQRLDMMYNVLEGHQKDVESYRKQGWLDF